MNLISKNRVTIQHRGRFLKTAGLLLIGMVSVALTPAHAAPKQRTIWVDREGYLADQVKRQSAKIKLTLVMKSQQVKMC